MKQFSQFSHENYYKNRRELTISRLLNDNSRLETVILALIRDENSSIRGAPTIWDVHIYQYTDQEQNQTMKHLNGFKNQNSRNSVETSVGCMTGLLASVKIFPGFLSTDPCPRHPTRIPGDAGQATWCTVHNQGEKNSCRKHLRLKPPNSKTLTTHQKQANFSWLTFNWTEVKQQTFVTNLQIKSTIKSKPKQAILALNFLYFDCQNVFKHFLDGMNLKGLQRNTCNNSSILIWSFSNYMDSETNHRRISENNS